jgi:Fe-S-cluster-containing dehydrogenase component
MKAFVIDVSICNGCYCYQIACKDEHVGLLLNLGWRNKSDISMDIV